MKMNAYVISVILSIIIITVNGSSRLTCTPSSNVCDSTDGEGSCCAQVTVLRTVYGNTETVGNVY